MESESDTLAFPEFADASVLLFDVHGVTVCCTEPTREFSVDALDMKVHPTFVRLVEWALNNGRHVAFVSYGTHTQLDAMLEHGLGSDLYSRVLVVTPRDLPDAGWKECYLPHKTTLGKHTLCERALEIIHARGGPKLSLVSALLIDDNTGSIRKCHELGGLALLFVGVTRGRCFGAFLEMISAKFDADSNPLATVRDKSEKSYLGYWVAECF